MPRRNSVEPGYSTRPLGLTYGKPCLIKLVQPCKTQKSAENSPVPMPRVGLGHRPFTSSGRSICVKALVTTNFRPLTGLPYEEALGCIGIAERDIDIVYDGSGLYVTLREYSQAQRAPNVVIVELSFTGRNDCPAGLWCLGMVRQQFPQSVIIAVCDIADPRRNLGARATHNKRADAFLVFGQPNFEKEFAEALRLVPLLAS